MNSRLAGLLAISLVLSQASGADYSTKCTLSDCDSVVPFAKDDVKDSKGFVSYTTSQSGMRLEKMSGNFEEENNGGWQKIVIDTSKQYQAITGFGGALTDAAAITINRLTDDKLREQLLSDYYTDSGISYSLGRVPMASCDFSTSVYSYDAVENDYDLDNFSIEMDHDMDTTGDKLGLIQRVLSMTETPLKLFASPWAPPAWMTKTNSTLHNPELRDEPEVYQSWALYFSKFFEAYRAEGVDFWGVTVQNEPVGNTGTWQDLKFSPEGERDFIKNYLGPQLRKTDPDLKIMMHDDQRVHLPQWTSTILGDAETNQYVDGVGIHWYSEVNDWFTWATTPFKKMNEVAANYPDKFILATEACNGFIPVLDQGPKLGSWTRGERYGYDILHDLNAFAVGWTDWNIALDLTGGPNWANNVVDAPIIVDVDAGDLYYKNPMYYYLGHFSKFLIPGSVRIGIDSTAPFGSSPMEATAFLRPDGVIAVVVLNRDIAGHKYNIALANGGDRGYINVDVDAHSIQTFLFEA